MDLTVISPIEEVGLNEPILKKHVGLIHCENKLSLLQRKICNILLFNALDKMQDEIHQISIKQLCTLIDYKSNDVSLIKKSLKRLMSTIMEWNLLDNKKFISDKKDISSENYWLECKLIISRCFF